MLPLCGAFIEGDNKLSRQEDVQLTLYSEKRCYQLIGDIL